MAFRVTRVEGYCDQTKAELNQEWAGLGVEARGLLAELGLAVEAARKFIETADLAALDRAFGLTRRLCFPFDELRAKARALEVFELDQLLSFETPTREWEDSWSAKVVRLGGETRADFRCRECGWEFSFVSEVGVHEELELPFGEFACPICETEGNSS